MQSRLYKYNGLAWNPEAVTNTLLAWQNLSPFPTDYLRENLTTDGRPEGYVTQVSLYRLQLSASPCNSPSGCATVTCSLVYSRPSLSDCKGVF